MPPSASAPVVDLQNLRSLVKAIENPEGRERFPFSSVASVCPGGIPRGVLVEITGPGKTEAVVKFLAENPRLRVAWIEDQFTAYPCAFVQRKVQLHRLLFVEAKEELFWAASQVLRSGLFECVVLAFQNSLNEKILRRLQLETEKANAGFFLLPEKPQKGWPISLKLATQGGRLNLMEGRNR